MGAPEPGLEGINSPARARRQQVSSGSHNVRVARVTVLGRINMDLVVRVPALPRPGDTVLGGRLLTLHGGKGANQAAAAARLGADVRMVARVGGDAFGQDLLRGLREDGIDVSGVACDPSEPSGVALIVVDDGGQNTVTVAPGANAGVGEAELARLSAGLERADVLVLQLEVPLPAVRAAVAAARAAGALVVLNAAPAQPLAGQAIPDVDVLVVNEGEAAQLSGLPVGDSESAEAAAARLGQSARAVVITLGAAGSVLWEAGRTSRVAARPVRAVDATAAGDAFVGAAAFGLAAGWPVMDAVQLGGAAGAAAATKLGARTSLPTRSDLNRLFGSEFAGFPRAPRS